MKQNLLAWAITALLFSACNTATKDSQIMKDELTRDAIDTLRRVLAEQEEWVKVHAAEFLTWTGNVEGVKEVYLKEVEQHENNSPYRIGIWRVLAQLSADTGRTDYLKKIEQAFLDTAGTDRIHAAETLGKLKYSPYRANPVISEAALNSPIVALSGYTHWAMAWENENTLQQAQQFFLRHLSDPNEDMTLRKIAAYVLRYINGIEPADWHGLADQVLALPDGSDGKINFLATLVISADAATAASEKYQRVWQTLLSHAGEKTKSVRIEIANALAEKGTEADLPLLVRWMHTEDPIGVEADDADVQASAAYAILKITER